MNRIINTNQGGGIRPPHFHSGSEKMPTKREYEQMDPLTFLAPHNMIPLLLFGAEEEKPAPPAPPTETQWQKDIRTKKEAELSSGWGGASAPGPTGISTLFF